MTHTLRLTTPFAFITLLLLWNILYPGYSLTLDMIFTPDFNFGTTSLPSGSYPFYKIVGVFSEIFAVWIVQKLILIGLVISTLYLSHKYLIPAGDFKTKLFTSLVYTLNPFVYTRLLAGHWMFLIAYSLLPLFLHLLIKFGQDKSYKSSIKLFVTLWLISVFSLHIFMMVSLITAVYFTYLLFKRIELKQLFKSVIAGTLILLATSSYWIIPLLNKNNSGLAEFDATHWDAFAPLPYNNIPVLLNLFSLNGFWGQGTIWSTYFHWPQDSIWFWISFAFIIILSVIGFIKNENRKLTFGLLILAIVAFIFSTGASDTIFKSLNIWMYENIPFWTGFRDSQKFSALLALVYSILAGYGFQFVYNKIKPTNYKYAGLILLYLIPFTFGFYMLGGFHGQLKPVWYPESWEQTKVYIDREVPGNVLVLPWHGYLSLNFNNNLIVANPARNYFGEKAVVSKSVELKSLYDQESDPQYRKLDSLIRGSTSANVQDMYDMLKEFGITHILHLHDLNQTDTIAYRFLVSERLTAVVQTSELTLYKIDKY